MARAVFALSHWSEKRGPPAHKSRNFASCNFLGVASRGFAKHRSDVADRGRTWCLGYLRQQEKAAGGGSRRTPAALRNKNRLRKIQDSHPGMILVVIAPLSCYRN